MSKYQNFVSDFPVRCGDLLEKFENRARLQKREVTLMLCVATPSIVVPLDRLKDPRGTESSGHPSRDWERFEQARSSLEALFDLAFRGSPLWPDIASSSWTFGELSNVSNGPDFWDELRRPKPLGLYKKAKPVLRHIRNALAHGNIFTCGSPEIEQIILLSERAVGTNKFNFLAVSPVDFRRFLKNWLEFLRGLKLPEEVTSANDEAVA